MIEVYKIGLEWYDKTEDKNGGLFEYRIIKQELKDILTTKAVLVIVNGKMSMNEETFLLDKMKNYDTTIFIATDIVAFDNNKNIIDASDYLLHQSPAILPQFYYKPQCYSYIPEMFYKYIEARKIEYNGKMIFGGGLRDNEQQILDYLNVVPSTAYIKNKLTDTRIPYHQYLDELAKHSYSLVISRRAYQKIGWITPRYTECLALNTLPICDYTYDKFNHFKHISVTTPKHLKTIIDILENDPGYYKSVLKQAKDEVLSDVYKFKILVTKLVGGYSNVDLCGFGG